MKWIKASERLPAKKGVYICEFGSKLYPEDDPFREECKFIEKSQKFSGYNYQAFIILRWLDESESPSSNDEAEQLRVKSEKEINAQYEIVRGYYNRIYLMPDVSREQILNWFEDDLNYLRGDEAILNADTILNSGSQKVDSQPAHESMKSQNEQLRKENEFFIETLQAISTHKPEWDYSEAKWSSQVIAINALKNQNKTISSLQSQLNQYREALEALDKKLEISIPYYAYGDNEAACSMAIAINEAREIIALTKQ